MKSTIVLTATFCGLITAGLGSAQNGAILPLPPTTVSTIPSNGDVNPYGVAFLARSVPTITLLETLTGLQAGDTLASNFNNNQNLQGTGTTIIRVNSAGQVSEFFNGASYGIRGLTAAIGILANGMVVVGNLPTFDGTSATAQPGALSFIDHNGNFVAAISNPSTVNGPWGLTIHDLNNGRAQIFVSNVLAGTVVRFDVTYSFTSNTVTANPVTVGSGFTHRTDPAALVLGPSGLAYDATNDLLYVASSTDNGVHVLAHAGATTSSDGTGTLVYQDSVHLHGPTQMTFAPNGHLIVANSDGSNADPNQPSELVEFTTAGQFISQYSVDHNNGGAFGVALLSLATGVVRVAYVDDNANTLTTIVKVLQ